MPSLAFFSKKEKIHSILWVLGHLIILFYSFYSMFNLANYKIEFNSIENYCFISSAIPFKRTISSL